MVSKEFVDDVRYRLANMVRSNLLPQTKRWAH
ncbi:hypothetical protein BLJAPNOD_06244 [Ensifer sp. M14]|nr:hypothetical protein BLJAPNOD_06244 [Ensifer sp. M14]